MIVLIMIRALSYFGILNPSRFLPDRCDFGNSIICHKDQFVIRQIDDGTVFAHLTNNHGSTIYVGWFDARTDAAGGIHCPAPPGQI